MLETEAKIKLCPFKLGNDHATTGDRPGSNGWDCEGQGCMAWDVWQDTIRNEHGTAITGHKPKEPPQGRCGMIPPELNCNYD